MRGGICVGCARVGGDQVFIYSSSPAGTWCVKGDVVGAQVESFVPNVVKKVEAHRLPRQQLDVRLALAAPLVDLQVAEDIINHLPVGQGPGQPLESRVAG